LITFRKPTITQAIGGLLVASSAYLYYQSFTSDVVYSVLANIDAHIIEISSQTQGVVTEIHTEENNFITEGDSIASIDMSDLKARLIEAQVKGLEHRAKIKYADASIALTATQAETVGAEFEVVSELLGKAREAFKEGQGLLNRGELSKSELTTLETDVLSLERQSRSLNGRTAELIAEQGVVEMSKGQAYADNLLLTAQAKLLLSENDKYEIDSPVTGVVSVMDAKVGQFVEVGDPIAQVVDVSELWVTAYIAEKDIGQINIGTLAQVRVPSREADWLQAVVKSISPVTVKKPHAWLPYENTLVPVKLSVKFTGYIQPGIEVKAVLLPQLIKSPEQS